MKKLILLLFLIPTFGDVPTQKEMDIQIENIQREIQEINFRLNALNPEHRISSNDQKDIDQERRIQKLEDDLEKQRWALVALLGRVFLPLLISSIKRGLKGGTENGE